MRYWQCGLFDTQAAEMDFDGWEGGRSQLSFENNTSDQEATSSYNPTGDADPMQSGYNTGDSNPLHHAIACNIGLTLLKAKLGQIPVLLRTDFSVVARNANTTFRERIYRMYTAWDVGDSTNRYSDKTALTTWYEDTYGPYPGQDRESTPTYDSGDFETVALTRYYYTITSIVERALRDNVDVRFMLWGKVTSGSAYQEYYCKPSTASRRPTLEFYYLYPIEFYESDGANAPDYASNVAEGEDGNYYLGAVERSATSTPVQGWIRNFTEQTKQVELFDDHPEWVTPYQTVGSGGSLDYVTLAQGDGSTTSQLYTVQFYSSTQYEVKAEAYRDNAVSYHPSFDADGSWRSDVSSDWTSPSGGLTIPAAAWQSAGVSSGDEWVIGVRGDTTDSTWPSDSNDQVEMTEDNSGVADSSGWRPCKGHRERTTASVTVDGASKFFPLRHVTPADWSVGDVCFVHDVDNIDEGALASVQERALAAAVLTGTGLDDCTSSGNYNGNANNTYRVQIDATGTPDTFSWSRDGTTSWVATGVAITGSAQLLENGVYVTFGATTGHTLGDYWTFDADTWGVTISGLTPGSNSYNPGSYVAQTLPIRDLGIAKWSTVDSDSGASQSPASRLYVADTSPFTQNDVLHVQQAQSGGSYEEVTIAAGGVNESGGYLDLTSSLVYDYEAGDFVTVKGSGEAAFWMRVVATSTTTEELKQLRFNARIL